MQTVDMGFETGNIYGTAMRSSHRRPCGRGARVCLTAEMRVRSRENSQFVRVEQRFFESVIPYLAVPLC